MADIADVYTDHVRVATSDYGVTMALGLTQPFGSVDEQKPPAAVGQRTERSPLLVVGQAQVRMSLAHAKVLAMILKQSLQQWESAHAEDIMVPSSVLEERGLKASEW